MSHWGGETASPLLKYRDFVNDSREYFGGRGIAHCPLPHNFREYRDLHTVACPTSQRRHVPRRKDCTQALPLHNDRRCTSEEEGTGPSSSQNRASLYFGGRGTGLLPRNVGEYMQLVLRCVLSMSASRGVPSALRMRLCWGTTQAGSLVTATHLEENSSRASWGEGVAVGPRFHSLTLTTFERFVKPGIPSCRTLSSVVSHSRNSDKLNVVAVRR